MKEIKIIIAIGILCIVFVNLTRIVWKITETNTDDMFRVACLKGGGKVLDAETGYIGCEKP